MKTLKHKDKGAVWTLGIALTMIILSFIAMTMGRYSLTLKEICAVIFPSAFPDITVNDTMRTVVFNVRLPRVLLALLAGAGMSVSGAALQSLFSNPLATPDTLGVATGSSFGAALAILLGLNMFWVQLIALVVGIIAVAIVFSISRIKGNTSIVMLILSGMVVSALFSSLVSLIKYAADPQDVLPAITFWLMGSLTGTSYQILKIGSPFILLGILTLFLIRWRLNAMSLNEDEAKTLGVNVRLVRILTVVASTMITASVVSMCGLIGWVGLLIPHISRMIFGNDNKRIIPASIGLGAIFMLVIDTIARCATASEIPVSILTAIVGAPFFIGLLRKSGGLSG